MNTRIDKVRCNVNGFTPKEEQVLSQDGPADNPLIAHICRFEDKEEIVDRVFETAVRVASCLSVENKIFYMALYYQEGQDDRNWQ